MVELQRTDVGVEATRNAPAAGFLDQDLLDTTTPCTHGLRVAARAPVLPHRAHTDEWAPPMAGAFAEELRRPFAVLARVVRGLRLELMPLEPVPNGRGA